MFRLASAAGVDPWDYTLRELSWMARYRQEDSWNKISHLMAAAINSNPYLEKAYTPNDFNPYQQKNQIESGDSVIDCMRKDGFFQ